MKNYITAAENLDIELEELLDILELTEDDAERENLTVDEILEAVEDACGGYDDWGVGDSIANYCESYYPYD
jgi:hypothetical protein